MHYIETHSLQEAYRILELLGCLAGETDDHIGADRAMRGSGSQALYEVKISSHGIAAPHAAQDGVISRLHRYFPCLAHLGQGCGNVDDPLAHLGGMRSQETDAPEPLQIVNG